MGPPNQSLPPSTLKENLPHTPPILHRRNIQPEDINPLRTSISPSSDILAHNYGHLHMELDDEKPSYEARLEASQGRRSNPDQHNAEEERQFPNMRDSILFNHQRMLQGQINHQNMDEPFMLQDPNHHPSLNAMNPEGSNNYLEDPYITEALESEVLMPKLYSAPPINKIQLGSGGGNMQQSNLGFRSPYRFLEDQGKALSGAAASLHLPSPPNTPLTGGDIPTPKEDSGTLVTTVYSYRCDRPCRQQRSTATVRSITGAGEEMQLSNPASGGDEMTPIPTHEERPEEGEHNQLLMKDSNKMLESTQTDTDLMEMTVPFVGDHATDEDLDDMSGQMRQLPPFFPNPDDLKWPHPDVDYLRRSFPPVYHPLLAPTYKKDPRTWLWKNEIGRRARQILATAASTHAIPTYGQQCRPLQCIENPPDETLNLGAGMGKASDGDSLTGISPRRDSRFLKGDVGELGG